MGSRAYLLSPQDLSGLAVLPELIQTGVSCLKIEGRLKAPEYVANVTRVYRQALDRLAAKANPPLPPPVGNPPLPLRGGDPLLTFSTSSSPYSPPIHSSIHPPPPHSPPHRPRPHPPPAHRRHPGGD
ncbi:MAG: peptidase U32 family protein [Nodosilinea sp.]